MTIPVGRSRRLSQQPCHLRERTWPLGGADIGLARAMLAILYPPACMEYIDAM